MSLSSTSTSLKSSATFNSNSSISSTPSADRYAALKDLDEQLREIKEKDVFNTQLSSSPSVVANPFKQALVAQQGAQISNPFQLQNGWTNSDQFAAPMTNGNGNGNGNVYASPTSFGINGNHATYGNGGQQQQYQNTVINGNGLAIQQNGYLSKNAFAVCVLELKFGSFED